MKRTILAVLLLTQCALAQEKITLDSPPPSASEYRVESLYMYWGPFTPSMEGLPATQTCELTVTLRSNLATLTPFRHTYSGDVACVMLRQLNKVNLSTNSLHRRIIERLVTDKVFNGTISGSPE